MYLKKNVCYLHNCMNQPDFIFPKEGYMFTLKYTDNPQCSRNVSSNNLCHQKYRCKYLESWTQKCNYHTQNSLMGENFNEFQLFKLGCMFLKSSCQQIMSLAVSEHNLSSTAMSTHLSTTSPQHRVLAWH